MNTEQKTRTTETAHLDWDRRWNSKDGRTDWLVPEARVVDFTRLLSERGVERVLDLGCGVGRHAVFLAQQGFVVDAFDASSNGLAFARQLAKKAGVEIHFRQGMMTQLPYENGSFDYVLAWNVIHHGDYDVVVQSIAEVTRVLRAGGYFQGTMLSKRNAKYGLGREVSPNTFVIDGEKEKSHPHFYCTARELLELTAGFEPLILEDVEQVKPGTFHWTFILQKL